MKKTFLCTLVITYTLGLLAISIAANTPTGQIRLTIDAVIDTLKEKDTTDPVKKQETRKRIKSLIRSRFDFVEMSKRSLARHWKKRTLEEKKEFVDIFSELLESSYIGKIEEYTNEKVTYDNEVIKGKGKYGVVKTTIVSEKVDIPIDYKVLLKKDEWWVYDVVVEGVSFISTYRSQYNKIIVKESYEKLLEHMRKKLDEIDALEK